MRSIKSFLCVAIFALSLLSCVNGGSSANSNSESPSAVALTLYKGLTSGDVKGVTENIYFAQKSDYKVFCDYFNMAVSSDDYKQRTERFIPDYKVTSEKIDGDNALVVLEGRGPLGNMLKIDVKLVSVDGQWKVDGDHGVFHYEPVKKD